MQRRLLPFILHATAAGIMTWGWLEVTRKVDWLSSLKGGYFLFLTNQGLAVAWLYMVISLLYDVFPSITVVRDIKRTLLIASMSLACVISTIYWTLISFFPHLIMSRTSRDGGELINLPMTLDLTLHVSPLITLLIDFFAFERKFSKSYVQRVAPAVAISFAVWYASFVEYCAMFNEIFPYPFLTYSPFPVRVLIYTAAAGIALGYFRIINALHS